MTKDYSLFVTGHSLGGSLATLFGYFLAQEDDLTENTQVTLYTFAAPPVGDRDFDKVFTRLENDGKLRHARIYNRGMILFLTRLLLLSMIMLELVSSLTKNGVKYLRAKHSSKKFWEP